MEAIELPKNNYDNLEELFEDWKEKHRTEGDSCKETFPEGVDVNDNFKKSFCVDGKFDDNASEIEILFICRESNVSGEASPDNEFWMQNVVKEKAKKRNNYYDCGKELSKEEKKKDKKAQTTYYNCLMAISNNTTDINAQDAEKMKNCAYMNINKRGGNNSCNRKKLKNYFLVYQNFILKEIELIKPNCIVILGNLESEIIDGIKSIYKKTVYLYPFHPSVYRKEKIKELKML